MLSAVTSNATTIIPFSQKQTEFLDQNVQDSAREVFLAGTFIGKLLDSRLEDSSIRDKVLAIGTPTNDLICPVTEEFLKVCKLESGGWHRIPDWEQFSKYVKEAASPLYNRAESEAYCPPKQMTGGCASNTIKILSVLLRSTAFLGKLGTDSSCQFFRNTLEKLNIELITQTSNNPINHVVGLITPEGQRTFLNFPSLSLDLSHDIFSKKPFDDVGLVYFEGYTLEEFDVNFIRKAMQEAKKAGSKIGFDLGCEWIVHKHRETILDLLKEVEIVFANEVEAKALLGPSYKETATLSSVPCPIVVVLMGRDGALISSKKGDYFESPAIQADPVDTLGAGDSFAAGFLYGYVKGYSLEVCAKIGNLFGGTVVTLPGAEIPQDRWPSLIEEIDAIVGQ